jgi:hypothetical protein
MNRRKFITTTTFALPSVTLLGAISTRPKTYRSDTSLYSNEEMTEWCNKNGVIYAKDDELDKKFFDNQQHLIVFVKDRETWLDGYRIYKNIYHQWNMRFECVIKDIYSEKDIENHGDDIIAVSFVVGRD